MLGVLCRLTNVAAGKLSLMLNVLISSKKRFHNDTYRNPVWHYAQFNLVLSTQLIM